LLDYAAWACGAPSDLFGDLSGTVRPFALMSNGGALAPCAGVLAGASGDAMAGLWTNGGFAFSSQFNSQWGGGSPTTPSSLAPAYGKFMAGGAQQVCSEEGLGAAAAYDHDAPYNSASSPSYPRSTQYDAGCLYSTSTTFVCKVPL
jgi:hypothetical protein